MPSHSDVIERWVSRELGKTTRNNLGGSNICTYRISGSDRYALHSYGSHFELARLVGDPAKRGAFWLLNGDTYSVTTARHQRDTRSAIERTNMPSLIVPHSALVSAGIELDSISPIEIEPERNERTWHTITDAGLTAFVNGAKDWQPAEGQSNVHREYRGEDGATYSLTVTFGNMNYRTNPYTIDLYDTPSIGSVYRNGSAALEHIEGDRYRYLTYRHFLGGSLFSAKVNYTRSVEVGRVRQDDESAEAMATRAALDDRYWRRHVSRREGGTDIVWIDEQRRSRRAYFLSSFDANESHPHYFLCELPGKVGTIAEAYESLKPSAVKAYESQGSPHGEVKRQGDVFAIPAPEIAGAFPIPFFHTVKRYFVERRSAKYNIVGTGSHDVTELVAITSLDGRTTDLYGKGTMRHGEHRTVKLDGWHLLVRNTVPLQRAGIEYGGVSTRRVRAVADSPRAWSIVGRID